MRTPAKFAPPRTICAAFCRAISILPCIHALLFAARAESFCTNANILKFGFLDLCADTARALAAATDFDSCATLPILYTASTDVNSCRHQFVLLPIYSSQVDPVDYLGGVCVECEF